jgi:large subunit ribosomal protein L17
MHRHGYQQRKLQRAAGPRRALVRGLVTSLVLHEQITTTEAKAKEMAPQFERLVTKAKKGDLHNRRQIRSFLLTDKATEKLIREIAPVFENRAGGYTRIVKLGNRLGDNAKMAAVMLTDKPGSAASPAKPASAAELAKSSDSPRSKAGSASAAGTSTKSKSDTASTAGKNAVKNSVKAPASAKRRNAK